MCICTDFFYYTIFKLKYLFYLNKIMKFAISLNLYPVFVGFGKPTESSCEENSLILMPWFLNFFKKWYLRLRREHQRGKRADK
jgi:hypothetical protein